MLRLSRILLATLALTQSAGFASAYELICPWGAVCLRDHAPAHRLKGLHRFRPQPWDGVPVVTDYPDHYDGYHGKSCIWSLRPVDTPDGPSQKLVPFCAYY
jgi:hypothetical protein